MIGKITVEQALRAAFKEWFTAAAQHTVEVIKKYHLVGPHPEKLAVRTGNLRNRIIGKPLPDGYVVGTNVGYGVAWETGIKQHTITAKKPGGVLAIPVASVWKGWNKQATRLTGLTRLKRSGAQQHRAGDLVIFRRKVTIPAQAPRQFLRPGIDQALPEVLKMGTPMLQQALLRGFPNKTVGR